MSKKLIISLSITFSCLAVILILFWTLFALSSVSLQYNSTIANLKIADDEILEAGEFRYGACVFFESKKASIEKINNHAKQNENFAYLRVLNIETKFPNKFVVYVAEREELFAVENDGQVLICDRDFRVLRKVETFISTQNNAILLKGLEIENTQISIGDFLNIKQQSMKKFYSVMLQNNRDLSEIYGKFKEIELGKYEDKITQKEYISMTMKSFSDRKVVINNIDFAFVNKLQKYFAVESVLFSQNTDESGNILKPDNKILYVIKTDVGEYVSFDAVKNLKDENGNLIYDEADKVALTYQILSNCYIKVDNLTLSDFVDRTENDIFYSLVSLT